MRQRKRTDYIVVHCSDTYTSMDIGADEIRKWHKGRGWKDIGYHFVIRRDGSVEKGRALRAVGAHVQGYNSVSVGICLVGGKADNGRPEDNFAEAQMTSLKTLIDRLLLEFEQAKVTGHNSLNSNRACPCFNVEEWWAKQTSSENALIDVSCLIYQKMSHYPKNSEVYSVLKDLLNQVGEMNCNPPTTA